MAVRELDRVDDNIITATGALSGMTHGTVAVIAKRNFTTAGQWLTWMCFHNSGGTPDGDFALDGFSGFPPIYWVSGNGAKIATGTTNNVWYLIVYRKATGTATGRFSMYNFGTDTWTHANGDATQGNFTAPGATGTVRFSFQTGDLFGGRVAARAAWSNEVKWAADDDGDAAIEAAGLHTSLQAWVDAEPSAGWAFNQASVTDPVEDWTGGGADQTAITGTAVITDDDPPGFDFDLDDDGLSITPDAPTVEATPGTVTVAVDAATQDITPGAVTVEATPGTVTVAAGAVDITPDAVTVEATPGTLTFTTGTVDVVPDPVTVEVAPGTVTVAADAAGQDLTLTAPTVEATPGEVTVTAGAVDITPDAVTVEATPGTVSVTQGIAVLPDAVTVEATPGTLTFTTGTVDITPDPVTVEAAPGAVGLAVGVTLTAPAVQATPGTVAVEVGAAGIVPAPATVTATPGTVTIEGGTTGLIPGTIGPPPTVAVDGIVGGGGSVPGAIV